MKRRPENVKYEERPMRVAEDSDACAQPTVGQRWLVDPRTARSPQKVASASLTAFFLG